MSTAARPAARAIDAVLVRRVSSFVAASVAVHALLIVGYAPGNGGAGPATDTVPARALSAVLAPAPSAALPSEPTPEDSRSTPASNEPGAPEPADATAAASGAPLQPQPGLEIPRPDRWYTAAELTAVAEPLIAPKLVYPQSLEGSGRFGRVRIRLFVDERGAIRKTELVRSAEHEAFDEAALKAWEGVKFTPAQKDGTAVKSQKLLELDFSPG